MALSKYSAASAMGGIRDGNPGVGLDSERKMDKEFLLLHPSGIKISPALKIEDLGKIKEIKERDMLNGWVWFDLPAVEINGKDVIFNLSFFKNQIKSVNISVSDPHLYGSDWENSSEEKELLRAKHTGEWLTAIGYTPGKYSWGEVWAGYDSKGGSGYGSIRFI